MGSSDNFCLRWNDFESNISTSFRELREDSEFLDVTLCCDNGVDVVQAHKVILAACSPLFRKILSRQKSTGQNPFLYLKGIRLKELRAVLDFIYHGEVNVAQDSLNNFLAVAEELAIKGLTTDSQKPGGSDPHANSEQRKKAVAKRKSVPQSSSAPVQIPVQAKKPKTDDDVEGIIEDVDVKGIKAEPEPSGSGVSAPNVNPMVEAELDDSYHGGGADDDNGDFGGGEEFEGFDQYGDGNEFDDSLGAAGASASAGADGKDLFLKYGGKESDIPKLTKFILIPGNRGGFNVLDENNFAFNKDKDLADGSSTWCCNKRNSVLKCRAVIKTADGLIIWQRREHNHSPDPDLN